jgi:hypothetical protein
MSTATKALPGLLDARREVRVESLIASERVKPLRQAARFWLGQADAKLPEGQLRRAMAEALTSEQATAHVLARLEPAERAVLAIYRRYGNTVPGEVLRLEVLARGVMKIEVKSSEYWTHRYWNRNPIERLADRWLLLPCASGDSSRSYSYSSAIGADKPLGECVLSEAVARQVEPAGPASWSVAPASAPPHEVARRLPAEVVLELSRLFGFLAGREPITLRKDGEPPASSVRAMEKTVAWTRDETFPLPDPHLLAFELLRGCGLVVEQPGHRLGTDPEAAGRLFTEPDAWQAWEWARAWISARSWRNGFNQDAYDFWDTRDRRKVQARQTLAWALGGLARSGHHWYDLETFLIGLRDLEGESQPELGYLNSPWVWKPHLPRLAPPEDKDRYHRDWRTARGYAFANALMITLVALGLTERGRLGSGASGPWGFRLTDLGRAVFGAPEVAPAPEPPERRFLRIQPNFDVVAYLDQAGTAATGMLGRIAEGEAAQSGPVQTLRLTQASLYRAQESGLAYEAILEFLTRHSLGDLPANVARSIADWATRRERLTLRLGVTVIAFPSPAERGAFLKDQGGTAWGERFVLAGPSATVKTRAAHPLVADHGTHGRRTLALDEFGRLTPSAPVDIVQRARLDRIAKRESQGWQISSDVVRLALASGLKPGTIAHWLEDHLQRPMPPLMAAAFGSWIGRPRPVALDDALLLQVADPTLAEAIAGSARFRPWLLGQAGPGWFLVRPEARAELETALEELGSPPRTNLIAGKLPAPGGEEPSAG